MKEPQIFTIHQAKTHLSRLVRKVAGGEEIIIARGKEPVARLVAIESKSKGRKLGTARGQIRLSDDFESPIEDFGEYV